MFSIGGGRVIAHSDLVASAHDAEGRCVYQVDTSLFQRDFSSLAHVQSARAAGAGAEAVQVARDTNGRETTYVSGSERPQRVPNPSPWQGLKALKSRGVLAIWWTVDTTSGTTCP
jgi:hypothetical protein